MFGKGAVKRVLNGHEIFHNVYDYRKIGLPHLLGQRHGARGVFIEDRLAILLSSHDLHCGWADENGMFFGVKGGRYGTHSPTQALEMGVNIIMYALSH